MPKIPFFKYHGYGNDFVVFDNITTITLPPDYHPLRRLCHRKYGVGADGFMVLAPSEKYAFEIVHYNALGDLGTLCGNGSRCTLAHARRLGLLGESKVEFQAYDGVHTGRYIPKDNKYAMSFKDVLFEDIRKYDERNYFLDNGCSHHVQFVDNVADMDIKANKETFWDGEYKDGDAFVNYAQEDGSGDYVSRTYALVTDREIDGCGTGSVAVALVSALRHIRKSSSKIQHGSRKSCNIKMPGGTLIALFEVGEKSFTNIELVGEATLVFEGEYLC